MARRREEGVLERRDAVALLDRVRRVEYEQPAPVEDPARRQLLEEGSLDRYAVDDAADGASVGADVVAEDACAAPVRGKQRREQPDERRLARAVLTQDRDALSALDLEGDADERGHADAAATLA